MAFKFPKQISWTIIRGDRRNLQVSTGIDLTGKSVLFTAKLRENIIPFDPTDSSAVLKKTAIVTDPTSGNAVFEFVHDDTKNIVPGEYFCDIQIVENGQPTSTNIFKIEIIPDASQRVA
jgi:hypothetical protein